jgi:hypothetical protein
VLHKAAWVFNNDSGAERISECVETFVLLAFAYLSSELLLLGESEKG